MLKINPTQEALNFHYEKVSKIFDKIINRNIGNGLLEDTTIKFIIRYTNILIKGKPELLLKVHQKFNRIITNQDFENFKTCFKDRAYENQLQKKHGKEFLEKLKIDTCIYCNRNYTLYFDGNFARAELKDLLDLRYKYSKNYLDILCNKTFEGLNLSQEEAYRMIFGIEINEEDYHKRPFSKFKHDIIEELKKSF